jgi:hypothetical protein
MTITLTDQELQYLLELLEREIPNLREEIHYTDDHDYREFLKERERFVKALVEKFSAHRGQAKSA